MWSSNCFASVFLLPQFFLWMWLLFFLISPSVLFWIFASLLAEKSIMFNCTTVYQSLYTMFSWFCSFHSTSIAGGHSNSRGISPVHYSFEHNTIPSPKIPQFVLSFSNWRTFPHFPIFFWHHKECSYKHFYTSLFAMISLGYKPSSGMAGSKGRQSFIALCS